MEFRVPGYSLRRGSKQDRSRLIQLLAKTYEEVSGTQTFDHLSDTVDRHLARDTPLWWVASEADPEVPIAGLWLGNAVDQEHGDRHSYVLALYVAPDHRRRGIATALLQVAQTWAQARGDRQIGLQVFANNEAAIALYRKLGYETHSLWLTKPL